jgi:hypothetical protein
VKTHLWILVGMMSGFAVSAGAQEPPPPTLPPVTRPPVTELPVSMPAPVTLEPAMPKTLTGEELTRRRRAIFRMEAVLIDAVKQGARSTAEEIQRFQPGLMMFSSAPVKARGAYLEGYGVFFQVDIPSVIPSVASLVETLGRDALNRERMGSNLAQPTSMSGESTAALINPDAHYVGEVKAELITAMVQFSQSLELLPGEVLVVSARDASEMPGQVAPPSTMTLHVKAADLADFTAGRISLDEIRRRVKVRGF